MTEALIKPDSQAIDLVKDPVRVLAEAKKAADELVKVVSSKPKPVVINEEKYLEYEDWQTLGRFYGLTVKVEWTRPVNFDGVKGWEARAVVLNRDGQEISSADAMCLNDEEKWSTKPKYEYQYILKDGTKTSENPPSDKITWIPNPKKPGKTMPQRERIKVSDEPVPFFQLRSMAQTRACAKAFRNVLAWVVVLAGYKPTPAEEMPVPGEDIYEAEEIRPTEEKPKEEPPEKKKAHEGQYAGPLISVQEKINSKKESPNYEKPYWSIKHGWGDSWTYDPDLAKMAMDAVKTKTEMVWDLTTRGQMLNLKVAMLK